MRDSSYRRSGLDLARNLAIFLVIVQHLAFLGGLSNDGTSAAHRLQARALEALSQSCVDLFGLLSGYLGISAVRWNWRKFARRWFQVWSTGLLVLGLSALGGCFWPSAFGGRLPDLGDWLTAVFPLLRDEYWYFTGYAFVFLMAPPINRFLFAEGRRRLGFAIAGLLFAFVCGTTACPGGAAWLPLAKGYSAAWLVCLFVFGAALRHAEPRFGSVRTGWFFASAACGVGLTVLQRLLMASFPGLKAAFADEWTLSHYTSPTVTFAAAMLLLGCARLDSSRTGGSLMRLSTALAQCAFGIYLLHVQPFLFEYGFKGSFAFLDRVPDSLFGLSVLATAVVLYLLFSLVEILRRTGAEILLRKVVKRK